MSEESETPAPEAAVANSGDSSSVPEKFFTDEAALSKSSNEITTGSLSCLLCQEQLRLDRIECHVATSHFNFMPYKCSTCGISAPSFDMVVTHALERGHSLQVVDETADKPYLNKLLHLIAHHTEHAPKTGLPTNAFKSLDSVMAPQRKLSAEHFCSAVAVLSATPSLLPSSLLASEDRSCIEGLVTCLICNEEYPDEKIFGHVAVSHFSFMPYRCPDCSVSDPYLDTVLKHALSQKHTVDVIDDGAKKPYLGKLVRFVTFQCRMATQDGNLEGIFEDLNKLLAMDLSGSDPELQIKVEPSDSGVWPANPNATVKLDKDNHDTLKTNVQSYLSSLSSPDISPSIGDHNLDVSSDSAEDELGASCSPLNASPNLADGSPKRKRRRSKYPVVGTRGHRVRLRRRDAPTPVQKLNSSLTEIKSPPTVLTRRAASLLSLNNGTVETKETNSNDNTPPETGARFLRKRVKPNDTTPIKADLDATTTNLVACSVKTSPRTTRLRKNVPVFATSDSDNHNIAIEQSPVTPTSATTTSTDTSAQQSTARNTRSQSSSGNDRTTPVVVTKESKASTPCRSACKWAGCGQMISGLQTDLAAHVWSHCSQLPFSCHDCRHRAVSAQLIEQHIKGRHRGKAMNYTSPSDDLREEHTVAFLKCFPNHGGRESSKTLVKSPETKVVSSTEKERKRKSYSPKPIAGKVRFVEESPPSEERRTKLKSPVSIKTEPVESCAEETNTEQSGGNADLVSMPRDINQEDTEETSITASDTKMAAVNEHKQKATNVESVVQKLLAKAPPMTTPQKFITVCAKPVFSGSVGNRHQHVPTLSAPQQRTSAIGAGRVRAVCNLCNEEVSTSYVSLSGHVWRSHSFTLPFTCGLCGHQDTDSAAIKVHTTEQHNGVSPVIMPPPDALKAEFTRLYMECFCSSELADSANGGKGIADIKPSVVQLQQQAVETRHQRSASKTALVSLKSSLQQHSVTGSAASQAKLLQCTMCLKKVLRSSSTKHAKTHLSRNSYECPYCNFGSRGNLYDVQTHVSMTHPTQEQRVINNSSILQEEVRALKAQCFPNVLWIARSDNRAMLPTTVSSVPVQPFNAVSSRPTTFRSLAGRSKRKPAAALSKKRKSGERTRICYICRKPASYGSSKRHVFAHLFRTCGIARYECPYCTYKTCWLETITNHCSVNAGKSGHPSSFTFCDNSKSLKTEYDDMFEKCFPSADNGCGNNAEPESEEDIKPVTTKHTRVVVPLPVSHSVSEEDNNENSNGGSSVAAQKRKPGPWTPQFCEYCQKATDSGGWSRHVFFHMFQDANFARYECQTCGYRTCWSFMIKTHCRKKSGKNGHPTHASYYDNTDALTEEFTQWRKKCYPMFEPDEARDGADVNNCRFCGCEFFQCNKSL